MTKSTSGLSRGWLVTGAGTAVNLCLGILYAWSVWKANLVENKLKGTVAGEPMSGLNEGWHYLTAAEATWAYAVCGFTFALFMIPGGRVQDRYGPRVGAIVGGLFLALGCVVAGLMHSYLGLILGFGILGGIGMGFGYAAATPAAVRWFGSQRRGLIVGLIVAGYGGAAIYISPLAKSLIAAYGISGSFFALGAIFAVVVIVAGMLLTWPPPGYVAAAPPVSAPAQATMTRTDWLPEDMMKTSQFYVLVFLFIGTAQSGLLVILNAAPILNTTAEKIPFFAANAWILASFGGLVNALGRVGTGLYSDSIGRLNAYALNGLVSVVCLLLTPWLIAQGNVPLLFVVVGVTFWQYGGSLSLMPALTADYYGSKNLGFNYGLVFLGWGLGFLIPLAAGYIETWTGKLDLAFYLSGGLLFVAVVVSRFLQRPLRADERIAPV